MPLRKLAPISGERLRFAMDLGAAAAEGKYHSKRFTRVLSTRIDLEDFGVFRLTDNPVTRYISAFNEQFATWDEAFSAITRLQALTALLRPREEFLFDETVEGAVAIPEALVDLAGSFPLSGKGEFDEEKFWEAAAAQGIPVPPRKAQ